MAIVDHKVNVKEAVEDEDSKIAKTIPSISNLASKQPRRSRFLDIWIPREMS
jgi:hypothetical protein